MAKTTATTRKRAAKPAKTRCGKRRIPPKATPPAPEPGVLWEPLTHRCGDDCRTLAQRLGAFGLSHRESSFLTHYLGNGGNGTAAAIAAGYAPKSAANAAYRLLRNDEISRALSAMESADIAQIESLRRRAAEIAVHGDLADFQPFLDGEKTLAELRAEGVNTALVRRATVKLCPGGAVSRTIELYDALTALRRLMPQVIVGRVLGGEEPAEGGAQGDRPEVVMLGDLMKTLFDAAREPLVPGLPATALAKDKGGRG
jgi:hypothetical protein